MTRRIKWTILGASVVLLTIAAELVVRPMNSSKGRVQVVNQADGPMDNLVIGYGDTKVRVAVLKAGQSTTVWFTAAGKGTLSLDFNQKGNPMKGFQVPEFDPEENLNCGLKLVLVVKDNRVERFMDDDESTTLLKNLKDTVMGWFDSDLKR